VSTTTRLVAPAVPVHGRRRMGVAVAVAGSTLGAALSAALVGRTVTALAGDPKAPWLLGRAAGITAYLLLVLLTATGLVLAHPAAARLRRPHPVTRLRLHAWLAAFTLAFVALHVVTLATDRYAHVGWAGALLPLASAYRPLPVTFGVLGLWSGLAAGVTAALAGRGAGRWWWRVHQIAVASLVLVWAHAVLAGSDTGALLALYAVTGVAVAALGLARHAARIRGSAQG
jgi:hypothetical protein